MYARKKSVSMKLVVLLLAVVLVFGCAVGGTLAWLLDKTDPVVNTYTTANIDITLTETGNTDGDDADTEPDSWTAKLIPGTDIKKDPKVTVLKNSEDCWLFVKIVESSVNVTVGTDTKSFGDYITYEVDLYNETTNPDGWRELDKTNYPGVYYREVSDSTEDQSFYVLAGTGDGDLKNGYVHIPDTVTKDMEDALKTANTSPTLTFTAYAVQKEGFTETVDGETGVVRAWKQAQILENNSNP